MNATKIKTSPILKKYTDNLQPTEEIVIDDLGIVRTYGTLKLDKMIEQLLRTNYIRGII